jgi:hypothetical protein
MADGYKSVVRQVARATGKAAVWTAAGVAGLWVLAKAGEMEAEEEAKRPPIIAKLTGMTTLLQNRSRQTALGKFLGKAISI